MKIFKKIWGPIVFIGGLLLFSTLWNFKNDKAFETITIFLSITTGFTITALSIIATSKFSKQLYLIEDATDNSRTLLHTLVRQIQSASLIFVLTIGLILIYQFFPQSPGWSSFCFIGYELDLKIILHSTIWVLVIFAFYRFVKIFNMFSNFVIQAAKKE
jgi:hypothetical protein